MTQDSERTEKYPSKIDMRELRGCLPKPKRPVSLEEMHAAIASMGGNLPLQRKQNR